MGGKVWSDLEEEVFWSGVARLAPPGLHKESKVVKKGRGEIAKSWAPLVRVMKDLMAKKNPGKDLPRKYTPISIYEHHFQNLIQGKLSPNAGRHVEAHRAWLKAMAENPKSALKVEGSGSFTSAESDSSELTELTDSNASLESGSPTTPENSISSNAFSQAAMPQQSQQMYQPHQFSQTQYMQQPQQMPVFQQTLGFQQTLQSQQMPQSQQMLQKQKENSELDQRVQVMQGQVNALQWTSGGLSQVGNGVPASFTAHPNGWQFQSGNERFPVTCDGPMPPGYHPFVNGVQFFPPFPPSYKNQD